MTAVSLIPGLQSDALAREIEQQLKNEAAAIDAAAEQEANATLEQARAAARRRMHDAIAELRREGERRLARARAQLDAALRTQAQRRGARAVGDAMPLVRQALDARWRNDGARKAWTEAIAALAATRLRPGPWRVDHPADWPEAEQRAFAQTAGNAAIAFNGDEEIKTGLRINADQAVLDATPDGLLADRRTIAALLLDALEGATP